MRSAAVLRRLYDNRALAPSGVDPVRFELERERRITSLEGHLKRAFPLTVALSMALEDDACLSVALDGLAAAVKTSDTIEAAAEVAFVANAARCDPRLELLLTYEGARRGALWATHAPVASEAELLHRTGIEHARLVDRPLRFGDFAQQVERRVRAGVGGSVLAALHPAAGRQIYAYWRADRMRAADVTELLMEPSS